MIVRVAIRDQQTELDILLKQYGFICITTIENPIYRRIWLESKMYSDSHSGLIKALYLSIEELETVLLLNELNPELVPPHLEELSNGIPSIQKRLQGST